MPSTISSWVISSPSRVLIGEVVVSLGDGFDETLAGVFNGVGYLVGDAGVRVKQVHDAGEAGFGADGNLHRDQVPAKALLKGFHDRVEVGVFPVYLGDEDYAGQVSFLGYVPHLAGADLYSRLGRNHYDGGVGDSNAGYDLSAIVGVSRGVEDVDLVVPPLGVQDTGIDARGPLMLFRLEVGGGGAVFHSSEPRRGARRMEHRLGQYSLASATMRQKHDIPDSLSGKFGHSNTPLYCNLTDVTHWAGLCDYSDRGLRRVAGLRPGRIGHISQFISYWWGYR